MSKSVASPLLLSASINNGRLLFWLGLLLTTIVYWPGLHGGYFFDDFPNIVENRAVQLTALAPAQLQDAALSSPSRELKRPLAMLSFALNHYFSGLAPFPMKLTNLLLHLLNGCLLFGMLRILLQLAATRAQGDPTSSRTNLLAALISVAWLLAPINLTPVLYVVQRMTSLSQLFVLAGLWLYLIGRHRQLGGLSGWPWILCGLLLAPVLGFLAKEEAILLPVFALAIEFTILRFRTLKSDRNPVLIAVLLSLTLLPALVGLAWLLPGLLSGDMFAGREFTLVERLLTEARVLILYMSWTLAPYPGSLSFYHDDLQISSGLLSPWTTGVSIMVLLALAALALACARRYPLISLGLIWFFAAHALTATVIPLELVFEHRNYFASIGLLLAIIPLILDWLQRQKLRLVTVTFFGVLLCWFGSVTAMRSHEWSDPVRLANSEAMIHPQSPRANYELGRILVAVSDYDASSPLLQQARAQFIISMQLPGASILPEQGLILIAGNTGQPTDPAWWQSITSKLSRKAPGAEDTSAIEKILHCQMERRCPLEIERTLDMFMAALQHSSINPRILVSYAQFAAFILGDMELAERVAHEAINHSGGLYHIRQALEPVFAITKSQSRPVTAPGQQ